MRSAKIMVLLSALLAWLTLSASGQSSQYLAIITEINGNAFLKKAGKEVFEKVFWGTQLFKGDQLKTAEETMLKLLYANNTILSLGPNRTLSISGDESANAEAVTEVRKISSGTIVDLGTLTANRENTKDVGALAFLRSDDGDLSIALTSPANTLIKTDRPDFSWQSAESFDSYRVNLYNSEGLVWSKRVTENELPYPEDENGLQYGETYFWNVEGEELIDSERSANHRFSLLSSEMTREVEAQEKLIRGSFNDDTESSSLHLLLGAYYMDQGLLLDAIDEFETISIIHADSPLPHEILGSLYTDVGNKDRAIEELQKALELVKSSSD